MTIVFDSFLKHQRINIKFNQIQYISRSVILVIFIISVLKLFYLLKIRRLCMQLLKQLLNVVMLQQLRCLYSNLSIRVSRKIRMLASNLQGPLASYTTLLSRSEALSCYTINRLTLQALPQDLTTTHSRIASIILYLKLCLRNVRSLISSVSATIQLLAIMYYSLVTRILSR